MKRTCLASLAVVAMVATGCNKNNTTSKNDTAGTSGRADAVSSADKDFVQDVSRANAAEINLSRLALEHSSSPDVKKFAQMMVDDHTGAATKLSSVASQNAIDAPAIPDDDHVSLREKLVSRQGLDFDRDYIDAMIDDHGKLVDKLESRVDKATVSKWKDTQGNAADGTKAKIEMKTDAILPEKSDNPVTRQINAWAAETYPVAYAHLQNAKALKDALKKRSTD
jgi:putative membrane protein